MGEREQRVAVELQVLGDHVGEAGVLAQPAAAAVFGDEDAEVGADVERVRLSRVDDERVHRHVGQRQVDAGPGGAAVGGLEDVAELGAGVVGRVGGVGDQRIVGSTATEET